MNISAVSLGTQMERFPVHKSAPIRAGFICSSDGGVLDSICQLAGDEECPFTVVGVVTDRDCGAEVVAHKHEIQLHRIIEADGERWSEAAANIFREWSGAHHYLCQ